MLSRMRDDPLRVLIALEIGAVVGGYVLDVWLVVTGLDGHVAFTWLSWAVYTALVALVAFAAFGIPHAPNREFGRLSIALIAICLLLLMPQNVMAGAFLFIALAARLTFAFGFRGSAVAWTTAILGVCAMGAWQLLTHQPGDTPTAVAGELFANFLGITLVFGIIATVWLYANKAAASAASSERVRIALDLHDSLGHTLTTLTVQLQNAERLRPADPAKADAYVKRAAATAASALSDVRETVTLLHDEEASSAAPIPLMIERLCGEFSSTHAIEMARSVDLAHDLPARTALVVYRVLQEALTNVARHSNAQHVEVQLTGFDDAIELHVRDDGRGIKDGDCDGHGIISMRKRVESLAGTLRIDSTARGTLLCARIPTPGMRVATSVRNMMPAAYAETQNP